MKKKRLQLDMTEKQYGRLDGLMVRFEFTTKAETIRRALELMERVADGIAPDADKDTELILHRAGQTDKKIVVL